MKRNKGTKVKESMEEVQSDSPVTAVLENPKRRLGVFGLLLVAFFWVSGGIYGNEALLEAGPPAYVFLLLILTPIFYAIPVSLLTGELSTSLPYDGGLVAWVTESCGSTIGAHCTYWLWTSYVFDGSIYPVLAAEYIGQRADLTRLGGTEEIGKKVVAIMIILSLTVIKLAGTDWMVRSTGIFFVGSLVPCLIYVFYGSKDINPSTWLETDTSEDAGGLNIAMLIAWVLWLSSGFFSLGCLAGEVHNPARTYPIVIVVIVPLVALLNIWPLAVAISVDQNRFNYEAGHFDELASELLGDWLGYGFVIGAVFCNVGLYNSQILVCERSLAAMLESYVLRFEKTAKTRVGKYMWSNNGTGVAPFFIIIHAVISCVFIWLPYEQLVELSILQMTLPSILCLYAFLYYKYYRPKLHRPFAVPGKMIGAVVITIPVFLVTMVNFYFAIVSEEEVLEMKYGKAIGFVILTFGGIGSHLMYILVMRTCKPNSKSESDDRSFGYTNDQFQESAPLLSAQSKADIHKHLDVTEKQSGYNSEA